MNPFFLFPFVVLILSSCLSAQTDPVYHQDSNNPIIISDTLDVFKRIKVHSQSIKDFTKNHPEYQSKFAFLIDMKVPSGQYRFFVVDLISGEIIKKGLTTHGSGSETGTSDSLIFSNVPNSYCSSLGKYKIGKAYVGNFGRSYRLHGLDSSNNKAFERAVVLHRYSCVPDQEQSYSICNSLGCPMLSENFFPEIDEMIKNSDKPVLMEIYY
jgi:hypothetical protein